MREQLRPFEGQLVFIDGRLTEASRRGDRHYFLMRNPHVTPWDGTSAVDLKKPATGVDHLWIDFNSERIEMMKPCFGLTRIRYYTRSNGTVDLGCEPLYHLLDCDKYQIGFHDGRPSPYKQSVEEHITHIDTALTGLDWHGKVMPTHTEPTYCFSRFKTVPWMRRYFKDCKKEVIKYQAAQLKAKARDKGKQRPCRSAGSFADLLR